MWYINQSKKITDSNKNWKTRNYKANINATDIQGEMYIVYQTYLAVKWYGRKLFSIDSR